MARCGLGSRRLMEEWITEGRVNLNGEVATLGVRAGENDEVHLDGKLVRRTVVPRSLLLYHKPRGKIVERDAEDGVFDDLPEVRDGRWLNVGRLDVGSEGLLLFTTDGEFAELLAHPSRGLEREYRARVNGALSENTLATIMRDGMPMGAGEVVRPVEFRLEREGDGLNCWYRVILREGRNRVVRMLFEAHGLEVNRLLRVRFGSFYLPPDLPAGGWRRVPSENMPSENNPPKNIS